jgi:hypothetical protein
MWKAKEIQISLTTFYLFSFAIVHVISVSVSENPGVQSEGVIINDASGTDAPLILSKETHGGEIEPRTTTSIKQSDVKFYAFTKLT